MFSFIFVTMLSSQFVRQTSGMLTRMNKVLTKNRKTLTFLFDLRRSMSGKQL